MRDEVKAHKYFKKESVRKNHATFFAMADNNGDGKIDRWELYDYCVKNMKTEWSSIVNLFLAKLPFQIKSKLKEDAIKACKLMCLLEKIFIYLFG